MITEMKASAIVAHDITSFPLHQKRQAIPTLEGVKPGVSSKPKCLYSSMAGPSANNVTTTLLGTFLYIPSFSSLMILFPEALTLMRRENSNVSYLKETAAISNHTAHADNLI